jgi:oxygen-independent coproporphyrinogen-3 oxidase
MTNNRKPAGLYIHIPFCKTKCPYCDFYSITDQTAKDRFLTALKREIALYQTAFPRFDSLYFGGGTPSVINEGPFTDIFTALRTSFSFSPDTEITVEMNPDDVTAEKLECYRMLGVNRISLGVQSLNDAELAFLKRRHTAEGARKALRLIREQGFKNFAIDLMNGPSGQTEKQWSATLKETLSYRPTHISCYQLTVADHTVFGEMARVKNSFCLQSKNRKKSSVQLPDSSRNRALSIMKSLILPTAGNSVPVIT